MTFPTHIGLRPNLFSANNRFLFSLKPLILKAYSIRIPFDLAKFRSAMAKDRRLEHNPSIVTALRKTFGSDGTSAAAAQSALQDTIVYFSGKQRRRKWKLKQAEMMKKRKRRGMYTDLSVALHTLLTLGPAESV